MTITSIQSTERAPVIAPAVAAQATQSTSSAQDQTASNYYFSPVLKIDPQTQSVVIQYRNAETGAVTNQYPSEKELKAYASQQKFADLETEPGTANSAVPAKTANQPAPTAVVDPNAVKPSASSSPSTAPATKSTAPATDSSSTASNSSVIV
jgi:hypothetical protein